MNRLVVTAAMAAVVATACGVGSDDRMREITSEDLFGLDQTTTSSTTTTSTTVAPTTTVIINTTTTLAATSTSIAAESVELFFLDGNQLVSVSRDLSFPASLGRVLTALEAGPPPGEVGIGLRTALPKDVVSKITESRGVATVELSGEVFDKIDTADERPAIAQMVLTLTSRSGIGQVRFTLDGAPLAVRRGDNLLTDPGEPVAAEDYDALLEPSRPAASGSSDPPPDTGASGTDETTPVSEPATGSGSG